MSRNGRMASDLSRAVPVERDIEQVVCFISFLHFDSCYIALRLETSVCCCCLGESFRRYTYLRFHMNCSLILDSYLYLTQLDSSYLYLTQLNPRLVFVESAWSFMRFIYHMELELLNVFYIYCYLLRWSLCCKRFTYFFLLMDLYAIWLTQAIIALKKGAYLLKYGRREKPKFCPFRLSNVSSFRFYLLKSIASSALRWYAFFFFFFIT